MVKPVRKASVAKRVALYARASSLGQAKKDLSIPGQVREMREYCAARGWEVVKEYLDAGKSGTTANRPQFQAMLTAATSKAPPFDVVLCYSIDRFGRGPADGLNKALIRENGVQLSYVVENVGEDDDAVLTEGVLELIARMYPKKLARVVKRGQRETVKRGRFGSGMSSLFGYDIGWVTDVGRPKRALKPTNTLRLSRRYSRSTRTVSQSVVWLCGSKPKAFRHLANSRVGNREVQRTASGFRVRCGECYRIRTTLGTSTTDAER
jgi:DNA invertase Pin-like site-specific DNA recombinase